MAFCKYCGSRIHDDSVFCSYCGKRLSDPAHSVQYPPPAEPKRPSTETAGQRAQRYRNESYRNNAGYGSTGGSGGSAPKKSPMKYIIPTAIMAFIVVLLLFSSASNRSGVKNPVSTPIPVVSISVPPEIYGDNPVFNLPDSSPKPSDEARYDEDDFYESIGDNVLAVLNAITERPDYVLGDFEPLIGVTDVNKNGRAEILAVYGANNNGYQVMYDVWSADSIGAFSLMSDVLFFEHDGNSGVLHLLQDSNGDPYVMLEQSVVSGENFEVTFYLYKFSSDETTIDYHGAWEAVGRYDENGDITEAKFYTPQSDWTEISAEDFRRTLGEYSTVHSLDIVSGEYDWDNTLSFDMAWKAFGQDR